MVYTEAIVLAGKHVHSLHVRLRELRVRAGYSQVELAEASGVGQDTISRYESGKLAMYDLDTIVSLASALGTGVDDLLKPPESTPPAPRRGRPKKPAPLDDAPDA